MKVNVLEFLLESFQWDICLTSFFQERRFFILAQPHDTPGFQRQCDISRVAGQSWGAVRTTPNFGGLGVQGQMERPIICLNITRLLIKLTTITYLPTLTNNNIEK